MDGMERIKQIFKTKDDEYVIGQFPNAPLIAAFILWVGARLYENDLLVLGYRGALLVWALLEIVWGVNAWRRILGSCVLLFTLYALLGAFF